MNTLNPEKLRQVLFIIILVLLGFILFRELQSFIPAFLGSITLYVLLRKWMFKLLVRKWKPGLAATVLMVFSLLVIMMPIYLIVNLLSSKVGYVISHYREITETTINYLRQIETQTGFKFVNENNLRRIGEMGAQKLPNLLGATFDTLTTLVMMYFILYFMLTQARSMEMNFQRIMPVKNDNVLAIRKEINDMVVSNAIGIPLIAIVQGIVALPCYYLLGVNEPILWFVITCFTAMLPMVGAALAYVPVAIILFASGDSWKGIVMLAFGFGVIGTVDNLFRFWLQKKIADVHPLITAFGVIIGVQLFGFIGLIFGPLLISMFLLLVQIYHTEFTNKQPIL
jgi:predicted PurR-regulated permease PerM